MLKTALVWSEAWNAEGEKGKLLLLYRAYTRRGLRALHTLFQHKMSLKGEFDSDTR